MVLKEMTPSQAEMMYSYCKSDSAVSRCVHYVKSKATLSKPLDDWKSILPKSSLGIKDDFIRCFRTGAGISCFLLGISVLLWVMGYGLWVYY
jgi:hypothetical protein